MSSTVWFRFFPSDWLAGTRGMAPAETGIYINLIAMMYEQGAPIPEDHARLARLCGASNSSFRKTIEALVSLGKISRIDGGLWNDRVGREQVYRAEKSEAGKHGAEKRWQKAKQKQATGDATAMRRHQFANAGSDGKTMLTRNQKPDDEDKSSSGAGAREPFETWWQRYPEKIAKSRAAKAYAVASIAVRNRTNS